MNFSASSSPRLLILLLGLNCISLIAQNKHDFNWILGTPNNSNPYIGGNLIDFGHGNLLIQDRDLPVDMWYPSIISDESGRLEFYANGCKIFNREDILLENGDEINAGDIYESYCNDPGSSVGYPSYQGHLLLPYPDHPNQYFYFHTWVDDVYLARKLLYSLVDMNANGGLGKVEAKNQLILEDTLSWAITATRHANGRDWWIVTARDTSSLYYVIKLDNGGVHTPNIQIPDSSWIPGHVVALSNVFSSDGSKFVRFGGDSPTAFRMYHFDRCNGQFYDPVTIHLPDTICYGPWGCFSPNSRFLYVQNNGDKLYQFDTWASDINASIQLVGIYDGFKGMYGLSTRFNSLTLGPDQRIYMSCRSGVNFVHTIHHPDEPGLQCDFRQHDLELFSPYPFYLSNMPFYRLYNLQGSSCDSLNIQTPMVAYWRYEQDSVSGPTEIDFTDISYHQPANWHWDFGDGFTSSEQSPTHHYSSPGKYNVCLTVCNAVGNCDTLCKELEIKTVGTSERPFEKPPFLVYPNPVIDYMVIEPNEEQTLGFIQIFNMQGQAASINPLRVSANQVWLDLHALDSGVYYLKVYSNDKVFSHLFVKVED
ncbi:MAG: PKD domain-containing protein [Saprospiraceae bacterium]